MLPSREGIPMCLGVQSEIISIIIMHGCCFNFGPLSSIFGCAFIGLEGFPMYHMLLTMYLHRQFGSCA